MIYSRQLDNAAIEVTENNKNSRKSNIVGKIKSCSRKRQEEKLPFL